MVKPSTSNAIHTCTYTYTHFCIVLVSTYSEARGPAGAETYAHVRNTHSVPGLRQPAMLVVGGQAWCAGAQGSGPPS